MQYVYDTVSSSWKWVDILGRAVQINDRFIVFGMPDQGDNLSISGNLAQGGLTGHTGKIATITGVAPYTYSFSIPVEPYAISVVGVSPGSPSPSSTSDQSAYQGYSFTFRGTHGTGIYGTNWRWIQFNGPQSLIDGGGLRYTGNILNIGQGTGITVNTNDIQVDNTYLSTQYLRLNGTNVATSVNTTGQFISTLASGTAPLVVSSTTNVLNLNASSLNGATFASPGPIGSTTPSTGAFTTLSTTNISFTTVTAGTWNGSLIAGQYGGTGVNNNGKTITLGGDLTTSGAFSATFVLTGTTSVTVPTSGTLINTIDAQTLTNKTLTTPVVGTLLESVTIVAAPATGTINLDLSTTDKYYYTVNATANWTFNFRSSDAATLDSLMSVGQSIRIQVLITNGAPAFYPNVHQVDGSVVTPLFKSSVAFATGVINSVNVYEYTIIKTAPATFTITAEQTSFA